MGEVISDATLGATEESLDVSHVRRVSAGAGDSGRHRQGVSAWRCSGAVNLGTPTTVLANQNVLRRQGHSSAGCWMLTLGLNRVYC